MRFEYCGRESRARERKESLADGAEEVKLGILARQSEDVAEELGGQAGRWSAESCGRECRHLC